MSSVTNKKSSARNGKSRKTDKDLFQSVTDKIIQTLEQGVSPWHRPWQTFSNSISGFPVNAITGHRYSGINIILLWMAAHEKGFSANDWLTFKQAIKAGGKVRKGESGTHAVVYRQSQQVKTDDNGQVVYDDNGNQVIEFKYFASQCVLFNVDQCENLPESISTKSTITQPSEPACIEKADQLIANSGVEIIHCHQNGAFYQPGIDCITLPLKTQFNTTADYYCTALHELVHATGHQSRLAREGICLTNGLRDKANYAFEELVAEIGSAFLCTELSIQGDVQHESYISYWLDILKQDKKAIFRAAKFAREAFEYLVTQNEQQLAA